MKIDVTDLKILNELQRNGKLTNSELSERVNLSPSPCLKRVKRLENSGLIRDYVALLNPVSLGLDLNVFIFISLKAQSRSLLAEFEAQVASHAEVMECYLMTGDEDYLLRVAVKDISSLERFIVDRLSPMAEVQSIRSSIALKQVRYKTALPLACR
jgi:DNA-binding Lrp family transcriptional regulator